MIKHALRSELNLHLLLCYYHDNVIVSIITSVIFDDDNIDTTLSNAHACRFKNEHVAIKFNSFAVFKIRLQNSTETAQ